LEAKAVLSASLAMASLAGQIQEAETKLANLVAKIEEIEELKALEPKLRRDASVLANKISAMKAEAESNVSEQHFFAKEDEEVEEAPVVAAPAPKKQAPAIVRDAEGERKAKMRAINKKLTQIEKLKTKANLDKDEQAKIASEAKLRQKLAAVEAGQDYESDDDEDAASPAPAPPTNGTANGTKKPQDSGDNYENDTAASVKLPTDPAEVEKRLKNLKKKLQQIAKLKEKGGALDEEALQKIASEHRINQEVAALEAGKDEVVFVEKGDEEVKFELEKKLKNVNKKLEQIEKLKKDGGLDADAQAKVNSESGLRKEAGELQRQIAEINKRERLRVAQRLGWESEIKENTGKKKGKK